MKGDPSARLSAPACSSWTSSKSILGLPVDVAAIAFTPNLESSGDGLSSSPLSLLRGSVDFLRGLPALVLPNPPFSGGRTFRVLFGGELSITDAGVWRVMDVGEELVTGFLRGAGKGEPFEFGLPKKPINVDCLDLQKGRSISHIFPMERDGSR